jgi:hypothetical protein
MSDDFYVFGDKTYRVRSNDEGTFVGAVSHMGEEPEWSKVDFSPDAYPPVLIFTWPPNWRKAKKLRRKGITFYVQSNATWFTPETFSVSRIPDWSAG